eukprot:TRINITY_DN7977_c0_g2_i1.p1 TRINITY_DN7977_c0_g2~~TRINITY_DN7977_c0_g2_i1.p1  ORF type:complete len:218 (-),score=28.36 TRINITY_DN7977_c0_g2_i1:264-917(-)
MSYDLGGWMLVMNIDTNDGNILKYQNVDFWTSDTLLGGASSTATAMNARDFKQLYLFSQFKPKQILIKVNNDGGSTMYQRSWDMMAPYNRTLRDFFSSALGSNTKMTTAVRTTQGTPLSNDPVISSSYQLHANTETGYGDVNRLSFLPDGWTGVIADNNGWGLGTWYDYSQPCTRPCADAVGVGYLWSGAIFGSDYDPAAQYGSSNSLSYSFAIYVK